MNRCVYQQTVLVGFAGLGEIRRGDISVSDGLVCPKPRRTGLFNEPTRPSQFLQINNQQPEACELKAGTELLDIILIKGSSDVGTTSFEMASSPPFFFWFPPTRASNPLIQDAQFRAVAGAPSPSPSFISTSALKNRGGCVPVKFGIKPAAMRIEGFNCCSSISGVA
ncbi:unnamed protein product [Withania somnifera]